MFMEVGAPHHRPHFHALYQDALATFALDPIECIGGELPRPQQRLVEAWAEIHHAIAVKGQIAWDTPSIASRNLKSSGRIH